MRAGGRARTISYAVIPILGILFLLWYIRTAAADVVYSDYIRLINDYLPDVGDRSRFLVPDILTRIPATFLARLVNVRNFGFSVTFDRMLTVLGMGLIAVALAIYAARMEIGFGWQLILGAVLFSLNKWEILLNGTAWAHVVSFGLFFINYLLLDLFWKGESDSRQELVLCLMPVIWLLFAGEYIASYAVTMMLVSLFGILAGGGAGLTRSRGKGMFEGILAFTALALALYLWSRHYAVWEHAGSTELSLKEAVLSQPLFFPRFFIKTFAGALLGQETIASFAGGQALPDNAVLVLGILVLCAYFLAFALYIQEEMMEKTVFPLVLLVSGFLNHVLVTVGRWIFLREDYALSSRYSGQFMIGIIGILLVFALYGRHRQRGPQRVVQQRKRRIHRLVLAVSVFIVLGNCYTTYQEIRKAPYREANYERMQEAILSYESQPEEELLQTLEWHKDPAVLYNALRILKENKLNVFGGAQAENASGPDAKAAPGGKTSPDGKDPSEGETAPDDGNPSEGETAPEGEGVSANETAPADENLPEAETSQADAA